MTHIPKNRFCTACRKCKAQRKRQRRGPGSGPRPPNFGYLTADHIISRSAWNKGVDNSSDAVLIYDRCTDHTGFYPVKSKSAQNAEEALRQYTGLDTLHMVYTDGSPELKAACRKRNVPFQRTSPPGKWRKNGRIERQVGILKAGTRSSIERSGLTPNAWPWAGKHFVFARNIAQITDPQHPNFASSPYQLRFGEEFKGHIIPFGAKIDFMPTPTNPRPQDQKRGLVQEHSHWCFLVVQHAGRQMGWHLRLCLA